MSRHVLSFASVPWTYLDGTIAGGSAMPDKQIDSESVMAGLYLGIAVAGVNALVAMGLVIAFM